MEQTKNYNLPYASNAEADAGELLEALFVGGGESASAMQSIDEALKEQSDALKAQKGTVEKLTIAAASWSDLADKAPFKYSAKASTTAQIAANTIVKLYNDDPILFAQYGFQIAAADGTSITVYALDKPAAGVTLSVGIIGG